MSRRTTARPPATAPRPEPATGAEVSTERGIIERLPIGRLRDIYLHASRLFVEKGYEATSMSDIAEAVNITKAGIYYFVSNKEELLFTIMSIGMDELEQEVTNPARKIDDPLQRLRFIIRAHLMNIGRGSSGQLGNPVTIVVDEPGGLSPDNRAAITARKRAYYDLVRSTVVALQDEGVAASDLDASVAAHCIAGMIQWMARWRKRGGRLSLDAIIDQITMMALGGLEGAAGPLGDHAKAGQSRADHRADRSGPRRG